MTIPDDPSGMDAAAYKPGTDPLAWAEYRVSEYLEAAREVAKARQNNPGAYPTYVIGLSDASLARSILGELLALGWVAPSAPLDEPFHEGDL